VLGLIKSNNLPHHVVGLLSELLHLPSPRELSKGVNASEVKIIFLGATTDYRDLNIFEEIAIRNSSLSLRNKELSVTDSIKGVFFMLDLKSWKLSPYLKLVVMAAVQKGLTIVPLWKMGISLRLKVFLPLKLTKKQEHLLLVGKLALFYKKHMYPNQLKTPFSPQFTDILLN